MKKTRGLISLLLSLAMLLSLLTVFAVASSGNGGDEASDSVSFDLREPVGAIENYSYITYRSEEDYGLDIADGSFDGMIDGSSCIDASKSDSGVTTLRLPTDDGEYYVVMLSDLTLDGTVKLSKKAKLILNLGGNTLTLNGAIDIGGVSNEKVSTELTIKNGNIDLAHSVDESQVFSARIGSSFTLDGIVARRNENATYAQLIQDSLSTITFRNTELHDDVALIFNIRPSFPGTNCTCNTDSCKEARKAGGGKPLEVKYTLDGFTYCGGSSKALFSIASAGRHNDLTPFYTVMDIEIKGGSELDTSVWFAFSKLSAVNTASQITLKIEEGTRFTSRALPPQEAAPFKIELVDKNGAELTDAMYGSSGRENFPLQLGAGEVKVAWCNSDGTPIQTSTYVKGAAPEYFGSVTPPERFSTKDGEIYMYVHNGWTDVKDNTLPQQIKPITEDTTLYACFDLVAPSIIEYSEDGLEIVNAYLEPTLNPELFESVSEGAYLIALADLHAEEGAELFARRSLTLDLRGRTLSLTKEGTSILTPAADVTFTVRRGTVYSDGISAVKSQGTGSVVLSDVRLRGEGAPVISLSSGTVSLRRGSVEFFGMSVDTPAVLLGSGVGNCRLEIYGTDINLTNPIGTASFIRAEGARAAQGGSDIEVLFAKDGDTAPSLSFGGKFISVSSGANRTLSLSVAVDGIDFTDMGSLISFNDTADASCEVKIKLMNGAKVAAQDINVSFDVEPGYTVLRPTDPKAPVVVLEKDLRAYVSLSVWRSLTLNLYVPRDSDVDFVEIFGKTVFDIKDKDKYLTSTYKEEYVCYRIPCEDIKANIAIASFSLNLGIYAEDGAKYYKEIEYSIVNDYCRPIIDGNYAEETKDLVYSVLSYIRAANELFGTDGIYVSDGERTALEALLSDYSPELLAATECDLSPLSDVVSGVQYELGDELSLILKLSAAAKGTPIKLMTGDTVLYESESCEEEIISVSIAFYDINDVVTVITENASATLDFLWYIEALGEYNAQPKVQTAAYAIYDLGVRAYAYEQLLIGSDIPDTPIITPDFD